ncbi:MAG: hypothetical protein BGO49_10675 [Planctomycetales bacterium 71-10]|nr:MAG: hypothetical protein BGO49_10675 [Planctomycetales bacterium 71-10]
MLDGDRAGADDAFQAVFLVLARKAGSLRRPDDLRPWLYGVAVKAGKEARRRAARIRAREGGALADLPAPGADADLFDLRAAIDEELERLPGRYREPILLCELEGASRRDAAERLGLAEGTLSSRLARGRSLLRDRLARRGLAVGALGAALAPTAKAAGLDALADASVRLMLASPSLHGPPGTASAAVAVAEGVLAMLSAAKLKALAAASAAALGVLVVTTGLAWGLSHGGPNPEVPAQAEGPEPGAKAGELRLRGVVVDEADRPLAGAEVRLMPFTPREVGVRTGPDGSYALTSPGRNVGLQMILARSGDGRLLGTFTYGFDLTPPAAPTRIVAKPAKEVLVRVADSAGKPVEGATVEAAGDYTALASATSAAGEVRIAIPADHRVQWIVAKKAAVGCDYAEFGDFDKYPGRSEGVRAADLPPFVALTLGEPRTVKIRALDDDGTPVAGSSFSLWLLKKEGKQGEVNYGSGLQREVAGPDGVAVFDWLPRSSKGLLQFWPEGGAIARRRVVVEPDQSEVVARLVRNVAIRGRVVLPDGSPAVGVKVQADGSGRELDNGRGSAVTAADGRYEMAVPPDEAYAVRVEEPDWAAAARMDVVVRRGRPVEGVDFHLAQGTVLKGTVTLGQDDRPATGVYVQIQQEGMDAPDDLREPGDRFGHRVRWSTSGKVDDRGRYALRLGPGRYSLLEPGAMKWVEIEIADQPELIHDVHMPRPERGPIAGRVIDSAGRPVADASVEFAPVDFAGARVLATTDADGRFATERRLLRTFVCAKSPDGSLGALVEIGPDDAELGLVLAPTATATGRLLDENGEPVRREKLHWGRRIPCNDDPDGPSYNAFAPAVVTDDDGRFTLPSLVVGETYRINIEGENFYPSAGVVQPSRPGPMDVGTLQLGSGSGGDAIFLNVAPKVGAVAPAFEATTLDDKPLSLGDFAGKYVLLDFWATWCGPCLGEMPHIRAAYDEFGKDGRLAVVSLSLDDAIDAPRKFQEERKLPWTVGWAKGGIASGPNAAYGVRAIPALFLIGPDGKVVDRGMRGEGIKQTVAKALKRPSR